MSFENLGYELRNSYVFQIGENIVCCQCVEAGNALIGDSVHGKGFAGASLTIGETGDLGPLESRIHKRPDCAVVDLV